MYAKWVGKNIDDCDTDVHFLKAMLKSIYTRAFQIDRFLVFVCFFKQGRHIHEKVCRWGYKVPFRAVG